MPPSSTPDHHLHLHPNPHPHPHQLYSNQYSGAISQHQSHYCPPNSSTTKTTMLLLCPPYHPSTSSIRIILFSINLISWPACHHQTTMKPNSSRRKSSKIMLKLSMPTMPTKVEHSIWGSMPSPMSTKTSSSPSTLLSSYLMISRQRQNCSSSRPNKVVPKSTPLRPP